MVQAVLRNDSNPHLKVQAVLMPIPQCEPQDEYRPKREPMGTQLALCRHLAGGFEDTLELFI